MTNKEKAISIKGLSKRYSIGVVKDTSFRASLAGVFKKKKNPNNDFWALKDVSFDVEQGEVIGIIGKNGAGKSTLLKVLSKITQPTEGRIEINGRVASLLEVGTGFHPELTGRENIYLNGTLLGMTRKEVAEKLEEIVEFSGVRKFIDTPVKHYSSGMYVRLAFSVAAHLEPEILIIDEVLAVGDAEFQKKCLGKMKDVAGEGRTVIFVSHDLAAVKNLCTRCVLLNNGSISMIGTTSECIEKYLQSNSIKSNDLSTIKNRKGLGNIQFTNGLVSQNERKGIVLSNQPIKIELDLSKEIDLKHGRIDIGINNSSGTRVAWISSSLLPEMTLKSDKIIFTIENFNLSPGQYDLNVFCEVNKEIEDWIENVLPFEVLEFDYYNSGRIVPKGQGDLIFIFNVQ
nr:ABC transporter ATP-binding protein [uncultured Brumimicrobium sp.]